MGESTPAIANENVPQNEPVVEPVLDKPKSKERSAEREGDDDSLNQIRQSEEYAEQLAAAKKGVKIGHPSRVLPAEEIAKRRREEREALEEKLDTCPCYGCQHIRKGKVQRAWSNSFLMAREWAVVILSTCNQKGNMSASADTAIPEMRHCPKMREYVLEECNGIASKLPSLDALIVQHTSFFARSNYPMCGPSLNTLRMVLWDLEHRSHMMHPGLVFEVARRLLCNLNRVSNWAAGEPETFVEVALSQLQEWHQKEHAGKWAPATERDVPGWVQEFQEAKETFLIKEAAKRRKLEMAKKKVGLDKDRTKIAEKDGQKAEKTKTVKKKSPKKLEAKKKSPKDSDKKRTRSASDSESSSSSSSESDSGSGSVSDSDDSMGISGSGSGGSGSGSSASSTSSNSLSNSNSKSSKDEESPIAPK